MKWPVILISASAREIKLAGLSLAETRAYRAVLKILQTLLSLAGGCYGRFDVQTSDFPTHTLLHLFGRAGRGAGEIRLITSFWPRLCAVLCSAPATGENLFHGQDSRNLIRYGGPIIRPDSIAFCSSTGALSYGLVEYLRIWINKKCYTDAARTRMVPHLHSAWWPPMSLNIAAGLGWADYPTRNLPVLWGLRDGIPVEDIYVRLSGNSLVSGRSKTMVSCHKTMVEYSANCERGDRNAYSPEMDNSSTGRHNFPAAA